MKLARIEDLPNIWDLDMDQEYLVEGILTDGSLNLVSGESGCGKSTVLLALANCVATGTPFLGHKCEQRKVLFVDGENGLQVYHERFRRLNINENPNMLFWGLWVRPEPEGPHSKVIMKFALEHRPLIIFDSFIAFHPGSEQDATETRAYMDFFRQLASAGATVVLIHHIGKGETSKEYRGSSDIKASVDAAFLLTARKPLLKQMELKPFKSREGKLDAIDFALEGNSFVLFSPKHKAWEQVVDAITKNPGINQQDLVDSVPSAGRYVVRNLLEEAVIKEQIFVKKGEKNTHQYYPKDQKPLDF
jgi:AAA domain